MRMADPKTARPFLSVSDFSSHCGGIVSRCGRGRAAHKAVTARCPAVTQMQQAAGPERLSGTRPRGPACFPDSPADQKRQAVNTGSTEPFHAPL